VSTAAVLLLKTLPQALAEAVAAVVAADYWQLLMETASPLVAVLRKTTEAIRGAEHLQGSGVSLHPIFKRI
jgi:predicted acyltransferase